MTETTTDKLTSVFLAALMVFSVFAGAFAFAGTAAAAGNATNGSVTNTNVAEQTSAQHDFHFEVDAVSADGDTDTFYVQLPDEYAGGITIDSVSAYNTSNTSESFSVTSQEVVDRDGDGTNEAIKFTIAPNQASDVDVSVDVSATLDHPAVDTNTDFATSAYVVDSSNADISDYALGTITVTSDEKNINDGSRYWTGQTLSATTNVSGGEVVELRQKVDGTYQFVTELKASSDGVVVLNTSEYEAGQYKLVDDSDNQVAVFELSVQSLSGTVQDSTVANGDTDASKTTFEFDSNRASYDAVVSVDGLTTNETASVFSSATKTDVDKDGEKEVVLSLTSNSDVDANFSQVDRGSYTFNFDVADTDASSSVDVTVQDENPANVEFDSQTYVDNRGDVVEITFELENTKTATFQLGGEDVGYTLNGSVTDGNDDGTVTVLFNTYLAGGGDPVSVKSAQDSVTVDSETTPISVGELAATSYDIDVFTGPNDRQTDIALVEVQERATGEATSGVAPGNTDDTLKAVQNATVDRQTIAMGDKVVVQYDVSGIFGYMDESTNLAKGGNSHGVYVEFKQTNPGRNTQAKTLSVSPAETYFDAENDTVTLVLDTEDYSAMKTGDKYNATLHVTEDNPYVEDSTSEVDEETATASFEIVKQELAFYESPNSKTDASENNPVVVQNTENAKVVGHTTLAPGTELSLSAKSSSGTPFLRSDTVTVAEDGTFTANFNLSDIEPGTKFTIRVGDYNVQVPAKVATPPEASASASSQTVTAGEEATLTIDSATLSDGGFIAVRNADGAVLGVSDYLEAGEHTDVEVSVSSMSESQSVSVVAYLDSDGSGDFTDSDTLYTGDSLATFDVTVEQPTDTPTTDTPTTDTPTTDTPTTDTPSTDEPTTDTPSETTETTTPGSPGFGIAVALIALVGAALLATRRE